MQYKYIDLFAGAGGWSLGASYLRLDVCGIELDKSACQTRRAAGFATLEGDVRDYDPDDFAGLLGLMASPPCQTFSIAGKGNGRSDLEALRDAATKIGQGESPRGFSFADERTGLVLEPLWWAQKLRPEWVTLEQVPPVLAVWQVYESILQNLGYNTWSGYVYAEQYGVPQTRKRAILIASQVKTVSMPKPTHSKFYSRKPETLDPNVLQWVSMSDALGWNTDNSSPAWTFQRPSTTVCGDYRVGRPGHKPRVGPKAEVAFANDAAHITPVEAGQLQSFPKDYPWFGTKGHKFRQAGNAIPPLVSKAVIAEALVSNYSHNGNTERRGRRDINLPAFTLTGKLNRNKWVGKKTVNVDIPEAGLLQGFPIDYPWIGLKNDRAQQVGNAVPPPLALAIIREVT